MIKKINLGELDNKKLENNELKSSEQNNFFNLKESVPVDIPPVKKGRRVWRWIFLSIGTIILLIIILVLYLFNFNIQAIKDKWSLVGIDCKDEICKEFNNIKIDTPVCQGVLCSNNIKNLPKTNNKTNILITGIDTRDNSSTYLTDTIILMSYNHETGNTILVSIPRDTLVSYKTITGKSKTSKINEAYFAGGYIQKNHNAGILTLQKIVSDITGETIHYNAMITLNGFIDLIDKFGGIEVQIDVDTTDVYPLDEIHDKKFVSNNCKVVYVGDGDYCRWTLKKGNYTLTGQMALLYARSRKYSSDFERARRQQKVIESVKTKVFNSSTLSNPQALTDIISTLKDNIKLSNYSTNDILAAFDLKNNIKKFTSVVLDPSISNGSLITVGPSDNGYGYHTLIKDKTFKSIHDYLSNISSNPEIYQESAKISIYQDVNDENLNEKIFSYLSKDSEYPEIKIARVTLKNAYQTFFSNYKEDSTPANMSTTTSISSNTSISTKSNTSNLNSSIKNSLTSSESAYKIYLVDYTEGLKPYTVNKILHDFPNIQVIKYNKTINHINKDDISVVISKNYSKK